MLKKRLIFTLLYDNGKYCLSRNFRLQRVGDLSWLLKNYHLEHVAQHIDELVILNVGRQKNEIDDGFCSDVSRIVERCFLPVSVGGGIRSLRDAERLFKVGADKIVLNTPLFEDPELVRRLSSRFGAQAIIASLDCFKEAEMYYPAIRQGSYKLSSPLGPFLIEVAALGVGEFYLTSMERDGTGQGFDFFLYESVKGITQTTGIPLIVSGGAGKYQHFYDALRFPHIDAVATANILNFIGNALPEVRRNLLELGVNLARW